MKLRPLPNTVVHLKTQAEYDEYMQMCEDAGWKWVSGKEPKAVKMFCCPIWIDVCDKMKRDWLPLEDSPNVLTLPELKAKLGGKEPKADTWTLDAPVYRRGSDWIREDKMSREKPTLAEHNFMEHLLLKGGKASLSQGMVDQWNGRVVDYPVPEDAELVVICTNEGYGHIPRETRLPHQIYVGVLIELIKKFPQTREISILPVMKGQVQLTPNSSVSISLPKEQ